MNRDADPEAETRGRNPEQLLMLLAFAAGLGFAAWRALLNNYTVEQAGFTGVEIGILQSIREVPGFLAFAVVFVLLLMREQTLAWASVLLLGVGTAATGLDSREGALYATTFAMSLGFHLYETVQGSLALQWLPKDRAPVALGRIAAAGALGSVVAYGGIYCQAKS